MQDCYDQLLKRGPDRVNPFRSHRSSRTWALPGSRWSSARARRSRRSHRVRGVQHAVGEAGGMIRLGRADAVFAGGTEAGVTSVGIAGFERVRALSRERRAGKGEPALRRGARRLRDGRGGRCDPARGARACQGAGRQDLRRDPWLRAFVGRERMSWSDPTGENPARAMRMALADAGIQPEDIDYINAHGTSTPLGDASETKVIKLASVRRSPEPRRCPRRRRHGPLPGSGRGRGGGLPDPRREQEHTSTDDQLRDARPGVRLDYVRTRSARPNVQVAVSNSFGFGGHNACIVFRESTNSE